MLMEVMGPYPGGDIAGVFSSRQQSSSTSRPLHESTNAQAESKDGASWTVRLTHLESRRDLLPLLWTVWVVMLISGSVVLLDSGISLYAGFASVVVFCAAFLPPAGHTCAPYFMHIVFPFFAVKGLREGGPWTAMNFLFVFVLLPLADTVIGVDKFRKYEETEIARLRGAIGFRLATWLFLPLQFATVIYACYAINNTADLTFLELSGFVVSVGMYCGAFGVATSHELEHKTNRAEQRLGKAILATIGCGHLMIEHNRGHHKLIATDDDAATARYGESIFSFVVRNTVGTFVGAWRFERDRCRDRNLPFWRNEIVRHWAAGAVLWSALTVAFGPKSLYVLMGGAVMGQLLFSATNFIEHYALERHSDESGRMEPVGPDHSWDTDHRMTNIVLFNIARHGDHHMHSTRRYQVLGVQQPSEGPQLPAAYPVCIIMALVPPLWRVAMHPRVHKLRRKYPARVWRHGPAS